MTPRPPRPINRRSGAQSLLRFAVGQAKRLLDFLSVGRIESAVVVAVGAVWLAMVPLMALSAAVDLLRGGADWAPLALMALFVLVGGAATSRSARFPRRMTVTRLFGALVGGTAAAMLAVMGALLLTGTTTAVDVAFAEAAATISGTNSTMLDVAAMTDGVITLRAAGQWASGAAFIVVVVRVLPHLGVGGLDADGGVATRSARRLSPRSGATMGRLLLLYMALTGAVGVGYLAAGMPFIDSGVHALTTISTGGFSARATSIAGYESAAIEWVAIAGMLAGGTSLPLMFLALRRKDPRRFARSFEFRLYLLFIVFVAFSIVAWSDAGVSSETIRRAVFASVSAVSTTGYLADDLTWVPSGGTTLLLAMMVMGGMSASVAGGFKVVRLLAMSSYISRELRRAIHPTATETVHLGRSSIGEVALSRIIGELLAAMLLLVPTVVVLSAGGLDVEGAFSYAISSLSNVGPAFGAPTPDGHLHALNGLGHLVAGSLMVVGRIGVLPMMVSVLALLEPPIRVARRQSRRLVKSGA